MTPTEDPNRTVPRSSTPPADQTADHISADETHGRDTDRPDTSDANQTRPSAPASAVGTRKAAHSDATPDAVPEPVAAPPAEGVSGYVLLRELGRGGMGVVYQARHAKLNRVVALKMMLGGSRVSRSDLIRFLAEAESVAAVKHENVVQVYDYGESNGRPFMALEFCPGGTLTERLRDRGPARDAAALIARVAHGVAAAHALGIVHRDLKPGNVFLDESGTPKVADFGLAKRGDSSDVTQTGQVMGTPAYMSPEQAKGETKFVGPQADVWALGVMLYEGLTGTRPFTGSVQEILAKVQNADPTPPRAVLGSVPRDLELVCLKCLAKAPHERYPTAKQLADDLDKFVNGEPISVRPAGALERGYKWVRRKPAIAALYAAVVASVFFLAVGGVLAWVASEARRAERTADGEREKARIAEQDAITQKGVAEVAEGKAKEALAGEAVQRTKAEQNAVRADQSAALAKENEAKANEAAYHLKVAQANQARQDNSALRALRLLSDTKPEHRNFEWRYVANLLESDVRTIRPGGRVGTVALSPDGRIGYLSRRGDSTVAGYDLDTGKEVVVYRGHTAKPFAVLVLSGGTRVASAAMDGTLDVWDAKTGARVVQLVDTPNPEGGVTKLVRSPDGKRFALAKRNAVSVWDAEKLEKVRDIQVPGGAYGVAFHPDGRLLIGGPEGLNRLTGVMRAWDLKTGKPVGDPVPHRGAVFAIAVAPNGSKIWTGDESGRVYTWDAIDFTPGPEYEAHDGRVIEIVFSADGKRLLTSSLDQTAALWEAATMKRIRTFRGHIEDVMSVAFRAGEKQVVTAGDGTLRVWDATRDSDSLVLTPPKPPKFPADASVWVLSPAFSPDGKYVAAATMFGVCVWEVATGKTLPEWSGGGPVSQVVVFSPDGKSLAGGSNFGRVWVRPLSGGEPKWCNAGVGLVSRVAFDPTGTRLAVAGMGGAPRVVEWATGKTLWVAANSGPGFAIAYSPDGKHVATAEDKTICIRDAETGAPKHTIAAHSRPIMSLAFSPDSKRLMSGSQDTSSAVWDVATGDKLLLLRTHDHFIYGVAFSGDGKRLVDACGDKTVRLYDARSGGEVLTLKGHTAPVTGAAFSPTGHHLATCSLDGTVRLWSAPPTATAIVPKEADEAHDPE